MGNLSKLFRNRLKAILREAHLSQAEFARQLGQAPTAVNRWISGETTPGLDTIEQIAAVLNRFPSELIKTPAEHEIEEKLKEELNSPQKPNNVAAELQLIRKSLEQLEAKVSDSTSPSQKRDAPLSPRDALIELVRTLTPEDCIYWKGRIESVLDAASKERETKGRGSRETG